MSNQVIGVAGVFVITFFLLALRHLLLIWGQASKRRHMSPSVPNLVTNTARDDSWLLRAQDDASESGGLATPEREVRTPSDFGRAARRSIHGAE